MNSKQKSDFLNSYEEKPIYILCNDINLSKSMGGGREFFDILELTEEEWIKGFAFRLRSALYQSGMHLYEIADRVDIAEGCISRSVKGKVVPSLYSISRLAAAIDCSVDELLPRDFVPLDDY